MTYQLLTVAGNLRMLMILLSCIMQAIGRHKKGLLLRTWQSYPPALQMEAQAQYNKKFVGSLSYLQQGRTT